MGNFSSDFIQNVQINCDFDDNFIKNYMVHWDGDASICPFTVPKNITFSEKIIFQINPQPFKCPRGEQFLLGCENVFKTLKKVSTNVFKKKSKYDFGICWGNKMTYSFFFFFFLKYGVHCQ